VRAAEVLSAAMERLLSSLHFTGPGQHRVAEWPRAEIRLRGGLLPVRLQVLGLGSVVEELERIHNQIIQAGRRKRNEPCVRQTGAGLF